jgi:hypothetical protein
VQPGRPQPGEKADKRVTGNSRKVSSLAEDETRYASEAGALKARSRSKIGLNQPPFKEEL